MIIKDFQFINAFSSDELGLEYDPSISIKVVWDSKKDVVFQQGKIIELHHPTTISKTLFNIASILINNVVKNPHKKDIISLVLHQSVHDYVYRESDECEDNPSVLISGNKLTLPTLIIKEIAEPLVDKKFEIIPVLYDRCQFTDCCRIVSSFMEIEHRGFEPNFIPYTRYPFILANCSIHNRASILSHVLIKQIEHNLGEDKTPRFLKKLLLNEDESLLDYLIKIAFMVEPDPVFVDDFLLYLKSYANLEQEEIALFVAIVQASYNKCPGMAKYAQNYNDSWKNQAVEKQWTQWTTMMGLIEKQLGGMRGDKRETSELMRGVDETRNKLRGKKRKAKGKKNLNFEELLEVYREQYGSEIAEPGTLHERLLQENRIW